MKKSPIVAIAKKVCPAVVNIVISKDDPTPIKGNKLFFRLSDLKNIFGKDVEILVNY